MKTKTETFEMFISEGELRDLKGNHFRVVLDKTKSPLKTDTAMKCTLTVELPVPERVITITESELMEKFETANIGTYSMPSMRDKFREVVFGDK